MNSKVAEMFFRKRNEYNEPIFLKSFVVYISNNETVLFYDKNNNRFLEKQKFYFNIYEDIKNYLNNDYEKEFVWKGKLYKITNFRIVEENYKIYLEVII